VGSVSWKPIILDLSKCVGEKPGVALFREAVQQVRELADPISNVRGSAVYKRHMAVEFALRALREAARRAA
jgi:CO/xanthine dehydrogenase FAD-binding subunit